MVVFKKGLWHIILYKRLFNKLRTIVKLKALLLPKNVFFNREAAVRVKGISLLLFKYCVEKI